MTVEEFLEKENLPESISGGTLSYAMIEFAKFHLNNFSKQFDLSIWTKDDIIESYIKKHLK
jgi:Na+/glutamate symporter